MRLEDLYKIEGEAWKATAVLWGVRFHVFLVRVHDVGGVQEAVDDPLGYAADVYHCNDASLQTVRVPGLEGDYVALLYPYAR